jgi:hypothetical protein
MTRADKSRRIIHFHSLKPDAYWYINGAVEYRWARRNWSGSSDDFYLAVLMWFRMLTLPASASI